MLAAPFETAADDADRQRFATYLDSAPHMQLMQEAIARIPPEIFQRCAELKPSGIQVILLAPIEVGPDGVPKRGTWLEKLPVKGCGTETDLNVFFSVGSNGTIQPTIGLPGSTRADPLLQRDGSRFAVIGAGAKRKDCKQFVITNTRFESFGLKNPPVADPGAEAKLRPWWETWTVQGCGHTLDVPMNFVPDETGTRIDQKSETIQEH